MPFRRPRPSDAALLLLCLAGALLALGISAAATRANGAAGFPLDDAWIHLQFARNLSRYGVFSYYLDVMPTSGSTSPLFTALLAVGLRLQIPAHALSIGVGVAGLASSAALLGRLLQRPGEALGPWPLAAAGLLLLEPRMLWAALSGMETTLFTALLLACLLAYRRGARTALGLLGGLLLWARPEAVIFFIALALDALVHRIGSAPSGGKANGGPGWRGWIPWLVFAGLALGYLGFNLRLSGSILPNTFAAKLAYYHEDGNRLGYLKAVGGFLATPGLWIPWALAACSIHASLRAIRAGRPAPALLPLLFILGMISAFGWKLPYLYQEGRYLMPVLPFILLLAGEGARDWSATGAGLHRSTIAAAALALALPIMAWSDWTQRKAYPEACGYILERQVAAALWLKENVPADARIATHDIGAIGFLCERRVVDMVGLVSPGATRWLSDMEGLRGFLEQEKATHVAVLSSWFEVPNQTPLWRGGEGSGERLEIFPFDARRTVLVPALVSRSVDLAARWRETGDTQRSERMLRKCLSLSPRNSRAYAELGRTLLRAGRAEEARIAFARALELFPESVELRRQVEALGPAHSSKTAG